MVARLRHPLALKSLVSKQRKTIEQLRNKIADQTAIRLISYLDTKEVGTQVICAELESTDVPTMRLVIDNIRAAIEDCVVVLVSVDDSRANVVAGVSKSIEYRVSADDLVKHVTQFIDGKGGGSARLGTGSGTNIDGVNRALNSVYNWVLLH